MQEFLLALTILRVLKSLRDDGGEGLDLDSILPQVAKFFEKDLTPDDVNLLKVGLQDLITLFRN